ncbi:MAG: Hsp70 family protein, partial [Enterobacteriaceae bacterium]|nr:Hsp70 family protein [Enterobacteriaceae bacterium]
SLGLETQGEIMTKLIERNTTIPTSKKQIFSTATDNQPAVRIRVLQGERNQACDNNLLGEFDLTGIPQAPRGIPQIEVSFDIDSNGILKVSAKDLSTNKEKNIVIKATGGLSEEAIKKMIKDAEINAEKDEQFKLLVQAKNQADNTMHSITKALNSCGNKIPNAEKNKIELLLNELKDLQNSDDKNAIESKTNALNQASVNLMQEMYKENSNNDKNNKSADENSNKDNKNKNTDETVVDTDYEEIKDTKNPENDKHK